MSNIANPYPYIHPKEILLTDDFSVSSERALAYARAMALRFGSHLVVLHVNSGDGCDEFETSTAEIIAGARAQHAIDKLRAKGVSADALCLTGNVEKTIASVAQSQSTDFVIIGTHAPEATERMWMGSMSEKVTTTLGWPVLLVGPRVVPVPEGRWQPKLIFSLAQCSARDVNAVLYGYHLAKEAGALFVLFTTLPTLHEEGPGSWESLKAVLTEKLPGISIGREFIRNEIQMGEAAIRVIQDAKNMRADLIVTTLGDDMADEGEHLKMLRSIVRLSPCPVMVVPGSTK